LTQLGYSTIMFRMDKVTYNKDGTPRKKGSGRKKGSNSLDTTTIGQLRDAGLNDDDTIVIGKKWGEELFKKTVDTRIPAKDNTPSATDVVQEKIAFKLTTFN